MIDTPSILWHYARTRHSPRFRSAAALARWQEERFQLFAERVLAKSPFYAPYVGRPLADYPLVDKSLMVANFDRMNTRGLKRAEIMDLALASERSRDFKPMLGDISVGLSSGTSGNRGLFAVSPKERRLYIGVALARCLPGSILGRYRIALLLRANNTLYEAAGKSGRIAFRFYARDAHLGLERELRGLGEGDLEAVALGLERRGAPERQPQEEQQAEARQREPRHDEDAAEAGSLLLH